MNTHEFRNFIFIIKIILISIWKWEQYIQHKLKKNVLNSDSSAIVNIVTFTVAGDIN